MKNSQETESSSYISKYISLNVQIKIHPKFKSIKDLPVINTVDLASKILLEFYTKNNIQVQECFIVALLNRSNRLLAIEMVNRGTATYTPVDIPLIIKLAIDVGATSIIVSHNHPSGNLNPSENDIKITQDLAKTLKLLNIELLDHIIVTYNSDETYSLKENNCY